MPRSISKLIWLNSSSLILSVSFMNGNMLNYVDGTWAKPMQVETYGQLQCHMSGFNVHAHQMDDCKLWAHILFRPHLPGSLIPPLPLLINIASHLLCSWICPKSACGERVRAQYKRVQAWNLWLVGLQYWPILWELNKTQNCCCPLLASEHANIGLMSKNHIPNSGPKKHVTSVYIMSCPWLITWSSQVASQHPQRPCRGQ